MNNYKVDVKLFKQVGDDTKKVKKELIIQAETLSDMEYLILPLLKEETQFPDEIEITAVKKVEYDRFVINDMVSVLTEDINQLKDPSDTSKHVELIPFMDEDQFEDLTYFFECTVEFFEMTDKGTMKKSGSAKLLIPADKIKKANEFCLKYMADTVTDWKIKDIKTTSIQSVILTQQEFNKAEEFRNIIENK